MLFLPLEEDSLLFRVCLYYGLVVLLLEIIVPLLFQRRVRVELPHVALHAPARPLSSREFRQQRQALQQQIAALQQATPRRSTPRRRQVSSIKRRPIASRAPSPCPSPTSSVEEVVLMQSPVATKDNERRREELENEERKGSDVEQLDVDKESPPSSPLPVGLRRPVTSDKQDFGAPHAPRPYSLPAGVLQGQQEQVIHEDAVHKHVGNEAVSHEGVDRQHADHHDHEGVTTQHSPHREEEESEEKEEQPNQERTWKQVAARTAARDFQLPDLLPRRPARNSSDRISGTGYNGTSEAALRLEALIASRRRRKPISPSVATIPPPIALSSNPVANAAPKVHSLLVKENKSSQLPQPAHKEIAGNQDTEERKEEVESKAKSPEKISDFKAFCASFARGGAAAAHRTSEKRKHPDAFENEENSQQKTPRVEDKKARVEATEKTVERPQEKTPRIVRRITFEDEVEALADTPSKEILQSSGKRKHQQAFGIFDEDDDDVEWRDSLAFRPRQ